jgi:hypothetical protein
MGGNQAMNDTADAIDALEDLAAIARTDAAVKATIIKYESKMIRRAFGWVQKSGGLGNNVREHMLKITKSDC